MADNQSQWPAQYPWYGWPAADQAPNGAAAEQARPAAPPVPASAADQVPPATQQIPPAGYPVPADRFRPLATRCPRRVTRSRRLATKAG